MKEVETKINLTGTALNDAFLSGYSVYEQTIELTSFKSGLPTWLFLDQTNLWTTIRSCLAFFLLTIFIPLLSHFFFSCFNCDVKHQKPYDAIVQLSFSVFATLSFISLSMFTSKYGLRRFLFLDKLCVETETVQDGYTQQIRRSMKLLSIFVLPCFLMDSSYKIWWFLSSGHQLPYFFNIYLSNVIVCIFMMCSWLYRTSIFFFVCILFRLICNLQILRMEDFAKIFERESDVASILIEHLRIRRHLRIISHRFRKFVLCTLILVTVTQLVSLLVTTKPNSTINLSTAGEVALCSITLVIGLWICLGSAAKITHKAQSVTSLAAKWHACAAMTNSDDIEGATSSLEPLLPVNATWHSDNEEDEEDDDDEDGLGSMNMGPIASSLSYQKRQALVTYFVHNKAGITVYGFMLDRTLLHTIFAIQLTLSLWILNKTILNSL